MQLVKNISLVPWYQGYIPIQENAQNSFDCADKLATDSSNTLLKPVWNNLLRCRVKVHSPLFLVS